MNINIFKFLPIFAASAVANASETSPAVGDIVRMGQQSYMIVFDFNSYPKYEEFQRNVQIMKATDATMKSLKEQIKKETDAQIKKSLELKLKQIDGEFQANDKTMVGGYNFSSNRQYVVLFLKTNICVPISPEEYSSYTFKDGTKINPLEIVTKSGKHFYRKSTIEGFKANDEFQRALQYSMKTRNEIASLRKQLETSTDVNELAKISEKIASYEKSLKESEDAMKEKYEMGSGQYMIEIEKSKLLLLLTPEELTKLEAERVLKKQEKN